MGQQPISEQDILDALSDLQSKDVWVRTRRIEDLRERKIAEDRIIEALKILAAGDPNSSVRNEAVQAIEALGVKILNEPVATSEPVTDLASFARRYNQQILGFIGWFVIASMIAPFSLGLITTPATVICLLIFGLSKTRKGLAGGILAAVSLNFLVSLLYGLSFNGICFMPFYVGM